MLFIFLCVDNKLVFGFNHVRNFWLLFMVIINGHPCKGQINGITGKKWGKKYNASYMIASDSAKQRQTKTKTWWKHTWQKM